MKVQNYTFANFVSKLTEFDLKLDKTFKCLQCGDDQNLAIKKLVVQSPKVVVFNFHPSHNTTYKNIEQLFSLLPLNINLADFSTYIKKLDKNIAFRLK
jgi:hypothetical protein